MNCTRREFLRSTAVMLAASALAGSASTAVAGSEFLDVSGPQVRLGGRAVSAWVQDLGLPFHLQYRPDIQRNVRAFQDVFKALYPKGEIRFAGKSCTHPEIFRTVAAEGAGIDVASEYETRCALQAGVDPHDLDVNGNCKEDALLEQAIGRDMLIVVDNVAEFEQISTLARRMNRSPRTVLRLAGYDLGPVTASAVFTAGPWTKFGIPLPELSSFLATLTKYRHVQVLGFHTHIGTQITEPEAYLAVLGTMLDRKASLEAAGGRLEMVNIGGGFPESYVSAEEWNTFVRRVREGVLAARAGDPSKIHLWDNSPGALSDDLSAWMGEKFYTPHPKERMLEKVLRSNVTVGGRAIPVLKALEAAGTPTLVIEPGRAIVGDTGLSVARVAFVRPVAGGHNLTTLEMGVTNYAEGMVSLPIRHWALLEDPGRRDPQPFETFLGGNLCFSGDMLSRVKIPLQRRPVRGELIMVPATGAYNPTFFAANANSFPRPGRVLVDADGSWKFLKKRDTYEQIFSL